MSSKEVIIILIILLVFLSGMVYVGIQQREKKEAAKVAEGVGVVEQLNCYEYRGQTSCEVWIKTTQGWTLCYRDVPKDIPPEDILCQP